MRIVSGPLKLEPRYVPKPWGGRRIAERFGREPGTDEPVGESWELYDRPAGSSRIVNGPLAGRRLEEVRGELPVPLLTKIIDARETLSVQVHPDAEAARELDGEAKTEAWYVLDAEPGARIHKGLREGVGAPDLLKALKDGGVEDLLRSFEVRAGDVVFLPAGTVHAIGAGVLLYEVQQNSDTTYRLYDWGRKGLDGKPRDLHVHQAVRSTDFSGPGVATVEPRLVADDGRYRRIERVSCPAFVLEEHEILGMVTFETERSGSARWHVLFVLSGEGTVRAFDRKGEDVFFSPGDSLLLPAEHERYEIAPRPGRTVRLLTSFL